uniref:Uncharacterized protein n=1 Tax=Arundo donax TaxID=35708 RepID=A0A0A9I1L8_ARUDO
MMPIAKKTKLLNYTTIHNYEFDNKGTIKQKVVS